MKVSIVFDITPQEALELMEGTSDVMRKAMTEQVTKALVDGTTEAYKEAIPKSGFSMFNPPEWWGKQTVYGDKD